MDFVKITYAIYNIRDLNESESAWDASYFIAVITKEPLPVFMSRCWSVPLKCGAQHERERETERERERGREMRRKDSLYDIIKRAKTPVSLDKSQRRRIGNFFFCNNKAIPYRGIRLPALEKLCERQLKPTQRSALYRPMLINAAKLISPWFEREFRGGESGSLRPLCRIKIHECFGEARRARARARAKWCRWSNR